LEVEMKKGNNCVIDLTKDVLPIKRKQDVKVEVKKEEGDKKVKTEKGEREEELGDEKSDAGSPRPPSPKRKSKKSKK
jgi:hypothetical protein